MFPVRTICPPLEQRLPKDNFVSFSTSLFSGATMFLQRGPQRQLHTKGEDFPQKAVAGTILLCVRSLLHGDCLGQGQPGSAVDRGTLSRWFGHAGTGCWWNSGVVDQQLWHHLLLPSYRCTPATFQPPPACVKLLQLWFYTFLTVIIPSGVV